MSHVRKRTASFAVRRALLCTVVTCGVYAASVVAPASAAVAEDWETKQWYLDAMRAKDIWKTSTGEGVKIALVDSGVTVTPSLKGQLVKGLDATKVDGSTDDFNGHGTTMAELMVGTGTGGGLRGLAPGAKVMPMRVADKEFESKHKSDPWDHSTAIRAAADSDAKIINLSYGSDFLDWKEKEAVKYAESKGKLLFAAVGNTGNKANKREYPANYDEVVGVAATDSEGKVAEYSQHGDFVDIAAPGNDIPRWCDESFTKYCDGDGGTSAATALASATAALIWSEHPDWTANQVLRVMFESAARGDDWKGKVSTYLGHGIVRPNAAINRGIGKPGDPNLNPLTNERAGGSAAPSAPASSQPSKPKPGSDAAVAGSSKSTSDGGQLGLIIGIGAAVVIAVGAFAVVRKRRSA
ncbi:S8 family serine peptidase [Streptomyces sp. NPDC058685]|uniref:S8 family serine peptidase n=1 Tax=Streptomyces sp. NPDC058685 TaxID=3346598 RepID=UPI00365684BD